MGGEEGAEGPVNLVEGLREGVLLFLAVISDQCVSVISNQSAHTDY